MKLLIVTLVSIIVVLVFITVRYAQNIRKEKIEGGTNRSQSLHKLFARLTFLMTLITVIVIEAFVRMRGGYHPTVLFWVHLFCFSVPFLATLFTLCFILTGVNNAKVHRPLGYLCLILAIGTVITGGYLLHQLPDKTETKPNIKAPHPVDPAPFYLGVFTLQNISEYLTYVKHISTVHI